MDTVMSRRVAGLRYEGILWTRRYERECLGGQWMTTAKLQSSSHFCKNVWVSHQGMRIRLFPPSYLGCVGCGRILKRAAGESVELDFNSVKKMNVLHGAEVPWSLMQVEAVEMTRDKERFQLERGLVPAYEKELPLERFWNKCLCPESIIPAFQRHTHMPTPIVLHFQWWPSVCGLALENNA